MLSNLQTLLGNFGNLVYNAIPIAIGLVMLFFIYEAYHYIHDPKDKSKMIAGVVALFVIVSIWGIVRFLQQTFGINAPTTVSAPRFPQ